LPSFNIEIAVPQGLTGSFALAAESPAISARPDRAQPASEMTSLNDVIDAIFTHADRERPPPLIFPATLYTSGYTDSQLIAAATRGERALR
jgi:hypothetical protein